MISNNFDDYIARYIEGYLFDDLETIHSEVTKQQGNLSYLYIFGICSAMDFLGALLRGDSPVKRRDGGGKYVDSSNAIAHYIRHYLKLVNPQVDYGLLQKIAPSLIRNGLAHCYAPKGPISVGRSAFISPSRHMSIDYPCSGQLFIHADQLYEDFKKSYDHVRPLIQPGGDLYERAVAHYEEMQEVYREEVDLLLKGVAH